MWSGGGRAYVPRRGLLFYTGGAPPPPPQKRLQAHGLKAASERCRRAGAAGGRGYGPATARLAAGPTVGDGHRRRGARARARAARTPPSHGSHRRYDTHRANHDKDATPLPTAPTLAVGGALQSGGAFRAGAPSLVGGAVDRLSALAPPPTPPPGGPRPPPSAGARSNRTLHHASYITDRSPCAGVAGASRGPPGS